MRRTITAVIALLASAVLLAGCGDKDDPVPTSPSTSTPSTTPTPSATPEEQAEAAAWKAYLKYEATRTQLMRQPNIKSAASKAAKVAIPPESTYMYMQVAQYVEKGRRQVGGKPVSTKVSANVRDADEVVFAICLDNRAIDVVDKAGKSVVLPDHPKKVKLSMTVKAKKGSWYVVKRDGGADPC